MKKIAALVLSGLMILSLGVASFAAQGDSAEDPGKLVIIDAKDKDGADIKDQVKVVENEGKGGCFSEGSLRCTR